MAFETIKQLGAAGEGAVCDFLKKNKFAICERNFVSVFGEIDIIAQRGEILVCVEVKTRKESYFPLGEIITVSKQRKIIATAQLYMSKRGLDNVVCRFDVARVIVNNSDFMIDYVEDAFSLEAR